jgi:hypothetical protein
MITHALEFVQVRANLSSGIFRLVDLRFGLKMLLILQKANNARFQTKGYHACFLFVDDFGVRYSPNLRKVVYTTFKKLLPLHHPFHTTLKIFFNGANEKSPRPTQCTTQ